MHSRCHATPAQLKTLTELVLDHCRAAGIDPKTTAHEDVAGFVMDYFLSGISDTGLISELLSLRRKQFLHLVLTEGPHQIRAELSPGRSPLEVNFRKLPDRHWAPHNRERPTCSGSVGSELLRNCSPCRPPCASGRNRLR